MTKPKPIDMTELSRQAQNTKEEAFLQLEKNSTYRIGVGARAKAPADVSFFMEITVNLPQEGANVDLKLLENTLTLLKILKARGYKLTYDSGCISCEATNLLNPQEESLEIRQLLQEHHL